jgi:hypothetical protein
MRARITQLQSWALVHGACSCVRSLTQTHFINVHVARGATFFSYLGLLTDFAGVAPADIDDYRFPCAHVARASILAWRRLTLYTATAAGCKLFQHSTFRWLGEMLRSANADSAFWLALRERKV